MPKRVFFSFHYDDVASFRANVVRNHWVTKPDRDAAGYFDASIWESAEKEGEVALKRLINGGLDGTSATCVLIGSETYRRPWVRYEILKSFRKGNHIFGVHINGIKAKDGTTKNLGLNPLEYVGVTFSSCGEFATLWERTGANWTEYKKIDGTSTFSFKTTEAHRGKGFNLGNFFKTYRWNADDGFNNFSAWADNGN